MRTAWKETAGKPKPETAEVQRPQQQQQQQSICPIKAEQQRGHGSDLWLSYN